MLQTVLLVVVYVASSVTGLALLKKGGATLSYVSLSGAVLYGLGFVLWYILLLKLPLSRAFPVASGALIIGTQLAGLFWLGEQLTLPHLIGVAFILAGVAIVFSWA